MSFANLKLPAIGKPKSQEVSVFKNLKVLAIGEPKSKKANSKRRQGKCASISPGGSFYMKTPRANFKVGNIGIQQDLSKSMRSSHARPKSASSSRASRRKDQYLMVSKLGHGQFPVHLAIHIPTFQLVAVKALRYHDDKGIRNVSRELKVLYDNICPLGHQGMGPIPNLVKFYDAFIDQSYMKLVMEYMDGGSLADAIVEGEPMEDARLCWITQSILKCLASLHDRKILHRDVKPGNVLISANGNAYLSDFGTAVSVPEYSKQKLEISGEGTHQFMCKERLTTGFKSDEFCYASDIWSLGMTVFCLAVGQSVPHVDSSGKRLGPVCIFTELQEGFRALSKLRGRPQLHDFLLKCLTPNPKIRPTAKDLLNHKFVRKAKRVCVCQPRPAVKHDQLRKIASKLYHYYLSKFPQVRSKAKSLYAGALQRAPQMLQPISSGVGTQMDTSSYLQPSRSRGRKSLPTMTPSVASNRRIQNTLFANTPPPPRGGRLPPMPLNASAEIRDVHSAPDLRLLSSSMRRQLTPSKDAVEALAHQLGLESKSIWKAFARKMPWIQTTSTTGKKKKKHLRKY